MIRRDQVVGMAARLPQHHRNPTLIEDGHSTCCYTDLHDPDWHCLAGEIIVRLGGALPDPQSEQNWFPSAGALVRGNEVLGLTFSDDAEELLSELQRHADCRDDLGRPITWGQAIEEVLGF